MSVTLQDKYLYELTRSFLDTETADRKRVPGDRWVNVEDLRKWVKLTFRTTDVDGFLPHFLKSSFVLHDQTIKKGIFKLQTKQGVLGDKSGIYTTHIMKRNERFSFKAFLRTTVEFLYAMPTAENRTSGIDYLSEIAEAPAGKRGKLISKYSSSILGTTNQAHIAKIVGISQARVSQICKDFLKVYSFKQISREEFENTNFEYKNENGVKSPLLRKYHLESGVDSLTGEVTIDNRYYVLIGSKLVSHFFFKSSIVGMTKKKVRTRDGKELEIEKLERRELSLLANSTKYKTQLKHVNATTNVQLNNKPKTNTRHYAYNNEVEKCVENNMLQIVAHTRRIANDKLTSFVLKEMILNLIETVKVGKLNKSVRQMNVMRKQIGREINLINTQLNNRSLQMDSLYVFKLQTISSAYNRIKNILKEVDTKILNQSKHFYSNSDLDSSFDSEIDSTLTLLSSILDSNTDSSLDNPLEVAPF